MNGALLYLQEATPSPTASRLIIDPPPPSGGDIFVAVLTIVLALAAAVVGYRIIRGGRGL
jgi:hypothetical protein